MSPPYYDSGLAEASSAGQKTLTLVSQLLG